MVQRIGYDSLSQDDVPGFATNKNPVLYKIDSEGSNMFFSFQGDHPQWSTDGQNFHDFYAGATDRKVYNCNYLDNNNEIPGNDSDVYLTNLQLIVEEGSAQLNYALITYHYLNEDHADSWNGDDARCLLTNVHDPADTMSLGEIVDSAFVGQNRDKEYWGVIGSNSGSQSYGLRFDKNSRTMFTRVRTIGQDYYYSGTINWKMRKS